MVQDVIHSQIVRNLDRVEAWFGEQRPKLEVPFYSSYDIRDSNFKVTNVDANIYPAGFNNICRVDRENGGDAVQHYLKRHYPNVRKILVLTEEHTQNLYYWDNVRALAQLIEDGGYELRLAIPRRQNTEPLLITTASGATVEVHAAVFHEGQISVAGYEPDLVISNNDFSEFYAELGPQVITPLNPPRELGWYQRKKSLYFEHYNALATDFARVIDVDPWLLTVETELFTGFDMGEEESLGKLAERVDALLQKTQAQYTKRGIEQKPFVFIKNNAGTYGLAVIRVGSAEEVMALNYKTRKKMRAAKGGREVTEVILQEGVPSATLAEGGITAEPAIYLVGCQLLGGFLRTHKEKDATESLNSPGAVFKRLCVSDLKVSVEGHPLENVYGWVAKLGLLAIAREARSMKVEFKGYQS